MTSMFDFSQLINRLNTEFSHQANRAINVSLILRNWYMGGYLHEYELKGSDRANYGEKLIQNSSKLLKASDLGRISPRQLRRYRQFYLLYPQIGQPVGYRLSQDLFLTLPEKRETLFPISGKDLIEHLSSPDSFFNSVQFLPCT